MANPIGTTTRWACMGSSLVCQQRTDFEDGTASNWDTVNSNTLQCQRAVQLGLVPNCGGGSRITSPGRNPGMGDWRGRSTYRNFDVAFFGGIPNNSGDTRFRNFNAVIPSTGQQTIVIDEPVLPAVVEDAPKVVRKNIVPFTAAVAGAVLGYYVFDSLFKFRFSNYVGVIAGGALGYGLTNKS